MNSGGKKALWKSNSHSLDTRLIITKTAIDALSIHQLFPKTHTRYISTEGMPSNYQEELVTEAIAEFDRADNEVIIAIGNDEADNQLTDILRSLAASDVPVKLHQPKNDRSWNECLRKQIEHNKLLMGQSKPTKQSQLEP